MKVRVWVRKTKKIGDIEVVAYGYYESETYEEASRRAEKSAEKKIREAEEEIRKIQNKCNHEFEPVWSNIHRCYYLRCKKCYYTDYTMTNPFDTSFFKAYRRRLIKIPHNL